MKHIVILMLLSLWVISGCNSREPLRNNEPGDNTRTIQLVNSLSGDAWPSDPFVLEGAEIGRNDSLRIGT